MKTEELMKGDWVSYKGTPYQVLIISNYFLTISNDNLVPVDRDYIEPIPITPEILEKNGFQHTCLPSDGVHSKSEWYGWESLNAEIYIPLFKGRPRKVRMALKDTCRYDTVIKQFNGNITSVHELQNALRLCGIEKEIEL